jgi:hypothetical protein
LVTAVTQKYSNQFSISLIKEKILPEGVKDKNITVSSNNPFIAI